MFKKMLLFHGGAIFEKAFDDPQLTRDAGHSINHTCKGIVELTKTY